MAPQEEGVISLQEVIGRGFDIADGRNDLVTHYAWTIETSGLKRIQKVTTLPELHDILQILKLPGTAPPTWLTLDPWRDAPPSDGRYIYDEGGSNEWSVVWTKVNYGPGDVN